MKHLLLFLRIIGSIKGVVIVSLIFSLLAAFSSVALLGLSAWFLGSAYLVASTSFNFFYPSSGVRGFAIGRTFFKYMHRLISHDATLRILTRLRLQSFASLLRVGKANKFNLSNSKILNLIVSDVDSLDNFFIQLILPLVTSVLLFIIVSLVLWFIDPWLGIAIGLYLLLMTILLPLLFYPIGKKVSQELNQAKDLSRSQLIAYLQLQMEYLLFSKQQQKIAELEAQNLNWMKLQAKRNSQLAIASGLVQILIGILIAGVLYYSFSIKDLLFSNDSTVVATTTIATFVILGCVEMLMPIANIFLQLGQIVDSAKNLAPLLEDKEAQAAVDNVIDTYYYRDHLKHFDYLSPPPLATQIRLNTSQVRIRIADLSFNYWQNPEVIFKDLNLTIAPQSKVAILGETGSGKSSLLNLLLGLQLNYQGNIYFDLLDQDDQLLTTIEGRSQQQRELITSLSQQVHVFNDSLENNLKLSNSSATQAELEEVLNQVGLGYLLDQELGFKMLLGMGGRGLSGGEVRRLGLARILMSDAPIILLDEPTESLDQETEQRILELLWQISKSRSLIMVTHRETGLNHFDDLLVCKNQQLQSLT